MFFEGDQKLPVSDGGALPALVPAGAVEVHLDVDQQQLMLFGEGAELLTIEEDERKGKYSGKIIDKNKAKVHAIVRALAAGCGQLKVAEAFSVSVHTVRAIISRHPELIAIEEKSLSGMLGQAFKLGVEQYMEAVIAGRIKPEHLPIGLGILFDKKQLLDGKPTTISSTGKAGLDLESMKRALAELPAVGPGEVIEIEGKSDTESGGQHG